MRAIGYIIGGGLLFFGGRYLVSLARTSDKAVVQAKGQLDKVTVEGVVVVLKFNIKNPTRTSITMSAPLIDIKYKDKVLASSSMALVDIPEEVRDSKGRIRILAFKETGWITTRILIPFVNLLGLGSGLVKRIKNPDDKVKFTIGTTATVFTAFGQYPYDDRQEVEI